MSIYFADKTWVELEEYVRKNTLIILPVGTIEQHGRHLPVDTDARIAEEVAKAIGMDLKKSQKYHYWLCRRFGRDIHRKKCKSGLEQ